MAGRNRNNGAVVPLTRVLLLAGVRGEGARDHGFRWEKNQGVEDLYANSPRGFTGRGGARKRMFDARWRSGALQTVREGLRAIDRARE